MDKLFIPVEISKKILDYVMEKFPEEACGLLAGIDKIVGIEFLITNQLHSPVKYSMDPMELYMALEKIEATHLDLLGIFHSHPLGPSIPSETDIKEFLYPGVVTIICFPISNVWNMKGFLVENDWYTEIELEVI